jgi:hypothetical protein
VTVPRTIVIGDVHGCLVELDALLAELRLGPGDALWFLGDLVDRGPDSAGVVRRVRALAERHGAAAVLGNHDEKHVRYRRHLRRRAADPGYRIPMQLDEATLAVHASLGDDDLDWLEARPVLARLAGGLVLVHAGLMPGRSLARPLLPLRLRYLRRSNGQPMSLQEERAAPAEAVHWSERWRGPGRVIYGHHARPEPAVGPASLGIDTGAVYGGHLTAAVLEAPASRAWPPRLVQVAARRAYHPNERWGGDEE